MTEKLVIDYAWTHPAPHHIKRAGIHGVMRYLSTDASKNITRDEAKALRDAGLAIGLVWETTATRATQGEAAGRADARAAEAQADALGYPKHLPIFFAVDEDTSVHSVRPYFKGVRRTCERPVGVYGGIHITDAKPALGHYLWQTVAWSGGQVSKVAHLYQRLSPTARIEGVASGWDENVVLHDFPMWQPPRKRKPAAKKAAPKPAPKVDPTPHHDSRLENFHEEYDKTGNIDTQILARAVDHGRTGHVQKLLNLFRRAVRRTPKH